jgi:hypothetical protein
MFVKMFTLFAAGAMLASCGRSPKIRVYLEEIQVPPPSPPLSRGSLPESLPPDHPLRSLQAPPLTVDPLPENLPPGHPTLEMAGLPALTDPNLPAPPLPSPGTSAAPMLGRESEVPPPPSARDLLWELPAGWRQIPGGGMRLASFVIDGDESGAITTLIVLGSAAGGLDANITRWRAERGLPPEPPQPPLRVGGRMEFTFVDFVSESIEAGDELTTVGAIFDLGDRTAFLKFVGPPSVVAPQRVAFLQLAGSLNRVEETP